MITISNNNHLVIGAGAVGQALTTFLHTAGVRVSLLARGVTANTIRRKGIHRNGILGNAYVAPNDIETLEHLDDTKEPFDAIHICTKALATNAIAGQIAANPDATDNQTKLVLWQNGWGAADIVASYFGHQKIVNTRIMTGFLRHADSVEVTVHAQPIRIGSLFHNSTVDGEEICRILNSGGLSAEASSAIQYDMWAKMLFNCIVNPLGALFKVPLGAFATSPEIRLSIDQIATEIFDVMEIAGYRTYWETAQEYLDVFYTKLLPMTASHKSSMLQDIQCGARTEIEVLNGAIVRLGDHYQVLVDHNRMVYQFVRFAETVSLSN